MAPSQSCPRGSLSCGEEFLNELSNPVTMGCGGPRAGEQSGAASKRRWHWRRVWERSGWPRGKQLLAWRRWPRGLAPPAPRRRGVCFGFSSPILRLLFLVAQLVALPAVQETWVQLLGWEDPCRRGTATHPSVLAWRAGYDWSGFHFQLFLQY